MTKTKNILTSTMIGGAMALQGTIANGTGNITHGFKIVRIHSPFPGPYIESRDRGPS